MDEVDSKPTLRQPEKEQGRRKFPKLPGIQLGVIRTFKLKPFYLVILVLLIFGGASFYFYGKYQEAIKLSDSIAGVNTEDANKKTIEAVSKLAELPGGEEPTIATVSDVNELSGQEFFKNAQNGDKVLIYSHAKLAYLYRPSSDKIVNIGPVNIPQEDIQGAATENRNASVSTPTPIENPEEPASPTRVLLLNGTPNTGFTRAAEEELLAVNGSEIEIVGRDNAVSRNYEEVIVVDVSGGEFNSTAAQIADTLGGNLSAQMPTGESTSSDVDIVVILGANYAN